MYYNSNFAVKIMPIKVTIRRDECISDGVCISLCPDVFEWGDDGKAAIVEQYRVGDDLGAGKVPDELEDCVKRAVESCPVQIIAMEKE